MATPSHLIAPSILSADFGNLQRDIELINSSTADLLHIDVMDGQFVPNISFGQNIVKTIAKHSTKPLDVHLMIVEPEKYVGEFIDSGAKNVSFHLEATNHAHRLLDYIKSRDIVAGIAINPQTNVEQLTDLLEMIDLVIIMSVNPGFGGQKFIYQTLSKIKKLRSMIDERNTNTLIEVDGGVGLQNAEAILGAGADVLVAGNSVFGAKDVLHAITSLKSISLNTSFQ